MSHMTFGSTPARLALGVLPRASLRCLPTPLLTRDNGAPVGNNQNSQTAGPNGPTLLQDVQLLQKLQRFGRERVPSASCTPVVPVPMASSPPLKTSPT